MHHVGFPGLNLDFDINPVAFTIFGKDIYWYGIIIAAGFCLALFYGFREAKRVGYSSDHLSNIILICVPVAIVCARLYFVAFKWDYYKDNLDEIIQIWKGGIAIYGGVIGACIAALIYCKCAKISFLETGDIAAGGLLIGQLIGRWGNFVNSEAYGSETDLPWRMAVEEGGKTIYVHPTFLYESLWNFFGFLLILLLRKRKRFKGELFYFYLFWYGLGRFWIEGLRTDSLYFLGMRVSQIVAAICVIGGAALIFYGVYRQKKGGKEIG